MRTNDYGNRLRDIGTQFFNEKNLSGNLSMTKKGSKLWDVYNGIYVVAKQADEVNDESVQSRIMLDRLDQIQKEIEELRCQIR